jgi:hypothetical protein
MRQVLALDLVKLYRGLSRKVLVYQIYTPLGLDFGFRKICLRMPAMSFMDFLTPIVYFRYCGGGRWSGCKNHDCRARNEAK